MRKNKIKIMIASAMLAFWASACSDSSTSTSTPTTPDITDENVQSSSSTSTNDNSCTVADSILQAISSSSEDTPQSSSQEQLSSSEEAVQSSSSEEILSSSSEEMEPPLSEECLELRSTVDTFPQVSEILKCLRKSEKVAFVLRHAARNKSATSSTDGLNDEGRKQSIELGKQLKDTEDIYFMYTKVYRTMETVLKIVEGKGQDFSESALPFQSKDAEDHMETADLEDPYLIKDQDKYQSCRNKFSWSWSAFSKYAYEENVPTECQETFYDIDDRLAEFIETYFTYDKMHNVTVAISHDKVMVPMAIAASQRKAHLQFHDHENDFNYWINYLTGIAIIVDEENNVTLLPATGVDDPYLRVYPEN